MQLKDVMRIAGWVILIGALASLGFIADMSSMDSASSHVTMTELAEQQANQQSVGGMVPWYGVFFIAMFGLAYLLEKRKAHTHGQTSELYAKIKPYIGLAILVLGLLAPSWFMKSAALPIGIHIMLIVIAAVLVALGGIAVYVMHKSSGLKALGYIIIVAISVVPGIVMMQYDPSASALGMAYYAALVTALLGWWGISLFNERKA